MDAFSSSSTPSPRRSSTTTPSPSISLSLPSLRSPLPPMCLTPPAKQGRIGGLIGEGGAFPLSPTPPTTGEGPAKQGRVGELNGEDGGLPLSATPPTKRKSVRIGAIVGGSRLFTESSTPPVGEGDGGGGFNGSADKKLYSVSRPAAKEVTAMPGPSSRKRRKTSNRPKGLPLLLQPAPVPENAEDEIPQQHAPIHPQQERCILGDVLNRTTGGGPYGESQLGRFLWISDLDNDVSEDDIISCFTNVSRVQAIELLRDRDSCAHLGCGLVLFPSEEFATKVLHDFNFQNLPPMKRKREDSYQLRPAHQADECNPRGFINIDEAQTFPPEPDSPISL